MKRFLKILGVCGILLLGFLLSVYLIRQYPWLFGSKPAFRSEIPVRIEVIVTDWEGMKEIELKTIDLASSCANLLRVLQQARNSTEHQCANVGSMRLHYRDGFSVELGILPGHHSSRYEFRYNHVLYSLSRPIFFEALKAAGVDPNQLSGEESKKADLRLLDAAMELYSTEMQHQNSSNEKGQQSHEADAENEKF